MCMTSCATGGDTHAKSRAAPVVGSALATALIRLGIALAAIAGGAVAEAATAGESGCHDQSRSELSRFWELEPATGCGVFGIRSYRPIVLSVVGSDSVNRQPSSDNPSNSAAVVMPYRTTEARIQLSVRSKLAEGIFTGGGPLQDSLWFGYTQQSYWQIFTASLSRPFRSTDHEPELVYVHPLDVKLRGGWKLQYTGIGLVHQSNGQSLPLSRSWNRVYLMAGAERAGGLALQGRVWHRLGEDAHADDNPGISDHVGRAEASASWMSGHGHRFSLAVRNTLRSMDRGSARVAWMVPIDYDRRHLGKLHLHTELFTGYGDSLLDYNRKRTVFSIGVSLIDW